MNHLKHLLFVSTLCLLVLFNGCIASSEGNSCGFFFWNDCDDDNWGEECYCGDIIEWGMDYNDPQPCFFKDTEIENTKDSPEYIIVKNNCSGNLLRICQRKINWSWGGSNSDTVWRDHGQKYCNFRLDTIGYTPAPW